MTKLNVTMFKRGGMGLGPKPVSIETAQIECFGQQVNPIKQINVWSMEICDNDLMLFFEEPVPAGVYHRVVKGDLYFDVGQVRLNHEDVERLDFYVEYKVDVTAVPVVSHFEVKSRGRCITFAPQLIGNDTMQWQVVMPSAS
jgi:hypothetical protein